MTQLNMWKKIEQKIMKQKEQLGDSTKEINKNLRIKMEQQNDTLDDVLSSVRRITRMMTTHMNDTSDRWKLRKESEAIYFQKLNESNLKLNNLENVTNMGLELQNEIKDQIQDQVEEMDRLRNQLITLLDNSSFTQNIKTMIEENIYHYDTNTKSLKLTISQAEYKILKWISYIDHDQNDVDVVQALAELKQGNFFKDNLLIFESN